jgi:aspartate aminotransferase
VIAAELGDALVPRRDLAESPTAQLESRVEAMRREGVRIYRLGVGEPTFRPPRHVTEGAIRAIVDHRDGYTDTGGTWSLREAIANRLQADIGVPYSPVDVIATTGAKHALLQALIVLCEAGDEVLLPVPYWVSFPEQIRLAGAQPMLVSPAQGVKVTPTDLARLTSTRTRGLILNSPANPTGAVYTSKELLEIASFCADSGLWVISDEVYSAWVYPPERHTSIAALPAMSRRTIVVGSTSKTYGLAGWRLGYAAGPVSVISAMVRLQSHTTSNPSTIAQYAGEIALRGPQGRSARHAREYQECVAWVLAEIGGSGRLRCDDPPGAGIFIWLDASGALGRRVGGRIVHGADDLAEALLEAAHVAIVPGTRFGSGQHLRISVAAPRNEVAEGVQRLLSAVG